MRNAGGYALWTGPTGQDEADTFTCCHCNRVTIVPPGLQPEESVMGWCRLCSKPICKVCTGKPCDPFEKKLDRIEKRAYLRSQYAKILGV